MKSSHQSQSSGADTASPESLTERLQILDYIFNQIQDELKIVDRQGRLVYVNDAAAKGLGVSKKKLTSRFITEFYTHDLSPQEWSRKRFALLKKEGVPINFQRTRRMKSGKIKVMDITAVYFRQHGEEFIFSIARDVTEQTEVHSRLKYSEGMYRLLSEEAGEPIIILDLGGLISYVNKSALQMLQANINNIYGMHYLSFIHPSSVSKAREYFLRAKKSSDIFRGEIDIKLKNGRRIPSEATITPIHQDGKMIALHVILRDISRRKEFEQLSLQAERMKAVQVFISGTSQELKHPLMAVLQRTEDLIAKYKEKGFEYISFREFTDLLHSMSLIQKQVRYCYDTVERMIEINKRKAGLSDKSCRANEILRALAREKESQLRMHGITSHFQLMEKLPEIKMGEIEFSQIATRLLDNAIEAMPMGGHLGIRTSSGKGSKFVQIEIKDDGVGISKDNMQRLFEPFFTTKSNDESQTAGLGLAIVQLLVKAVDGTIKISSSLRNGTMVSLCIPVAHQAAISRKH